MMNMDINLLINIVCVIASICFFVAKLDAMTKANRQFYETTIASLHENINEKFDFLEGNIAEKFRVVDERFVNMASHVDRLERKQEESNRIKERLAILEYTMKMLMESRDYGSIIDSFDSLKSDK